MLGWDKKSDKRNLIRKDFQILRRELAMVEKSRPDGRLSFLGLILIKIGLSLLKMDHQQHMKMIK